MTEIKQPSFFELWQMSKEALALLASAREIFLRAETEPGLAEALNFKYEAMLLQVKAIEILETSDRLFRNQLDREKTSIRRQRVELQSIQL